MSDYIYRNFENLRYPQVFSFYMNHIFPFKLKLSLKESEILEKTLYEVEPFFRKKVSELQHYLDLFERINKKDTPLYKRIAACFLHSNLTNRKPRIKKFF